MKNGFYSKLAWNNIKKNYRFFIPRVFAEIGLLGCFYIALTLAMDERLSKIKGGNYIPTFMFMAVIILGLLSAVLMFYTNAFLMKQRKREFGLYNVLGMEKRHVAKVMFHESFISWAIASIGGLGFGVLFYKLCSLLVCRLLKADIIVGLYYIRPLSLLPSAAYFFLLDLLTFVFNLISIERMEPVELLQSKAAGEKEPRVKWLMLIIGAASLGYGYYIALTTLSPLSAMNMFLFAVLLVIIGTYFLFVAGSIFVLKALKKNSRYYYNKKHMPAVSGLLYRMKHNAVGLSSIAILATGVIVMISTTVSLYSGLEGTMNKNYPQHLYISANSNSEDGNESIPADVLEDIVRSAAEKNGAELSSVNKDEYLQVAYYLQDGVLHTEADAVGSVSYSALCNFIFITNDLYEKQTGERLDLDGNAVAIACISSSGDNGEKIGDSFTVHGTDYKIKKELVTFPISIPILSNGFATYGVVLSDREVLETIYNGQFEAYGRDASSLIVRLAVTFADLDKACDVGYEIDEAIDDSLEEYFSSIGTGYGYDLNTYWDTRDSVIGMYGTLLFLGILLGSVCMFATVLIIYYKQISEGYEDRNRFLIMEKIGLSKREVRSTINSQVLMVFFLPLAVAGIHMIFAYPLLKRLLSILMLYDTKLFLVCTLVTYGVFAGVYTLIYAGTSKTYYNIVN